MRGMRCILLYSIMLALTACGDTGEVKQGKVEKTAESPAVTKEPSLLNSTYTYCNDRYAFINENGIDQYRLDGTFVKNYRLTDSYSVCYVDNDWMYYEGSNGEEDALFRIPITKRQGMDLVLDEGKKEEVVCEEDGFMSDIYFVGDCIWYIDGTMMCNEYNLKKKTFGNTFGSIMHWDGANLFAQCGNWLLLDGKDAVYQVNPLTDQYNKLTYEFGEDDMYLGTGDTLYWCPFVEKTIKNDCIERAESEYRELEEGVYRHDIKTAKTKLLVSQKELAKEIVKGNEWGITEEMMDSCEVILMKHSRNRLFIQVQVGWHKGEDYYYDYVVLSSDGKRKKSLQYETEINRLIHEGSGAIRSTWLNNPYVSRGESNLYENPSSFIGAIKGNLFLASYIRKEKTFQVKYYNLETKEMKILKDGDIEMLYMKSGTCWWYLINQTEMDYYPENMDIRRIKYEVGENE